MFKHKINKNTWIYLFNREDQAPKLKTQNRHTTEKTKEKAIEKPNTGSERAAAEGAGAGADPGDAEARAGDGDGADDGASWWWSCADKPCVAKTNTTISIIIITALLEPIVY